MFYKKLNELKRDKKLASFYTNTNDTSKFTVGYVVESDDDYFVIAAISKYGLFDGFLLKEINSIFRVNVDSMYEEKILKLSNYYNTVPEILHFKGDNLILELLSFAKMKNYVVSIELLNSKYNDIQGYVETINANMCTIKQITEYGAIDGIALFDISDVTAISCNSEDEKNLHILYSDKG